MRRDRLLILGVILVAGLLLARGAQGAVRDGIVVPLLEIFWIGQMLVETTSQGFFWTALVIVGIALAVKGFWDGPPRFARDAELEPRRGPVAALTVMIHRCARDEYSRWRLAQRLAQLAVETLAQRHAISPREARGGIEDGRFAIPPAIAAYLRAGLGQFQNRPGSRGRVRSGGPLDVDVQSVVAWLEEADR